MRSDRDILAALEPALRVTPDAVPLHGRWVSPPYPPRAVDGRPLAVIRIDEPISSLVVDRVDGGVFLIGWGGDMTLVNASLERFVECVLLYGKVVRAARRIAADDAAALAALVARARARLEEIDARAVRGPDQIWSLAMAHVERGRCRKPPAGRRPRRAQRSSVTRASRAARATDPAR